MFKKRNFVVFQWTELFFQYIILHSFFIVKIFKRNFFDFSIPIIDFTIIFSVHLNNSFWNVVIFVHINVFILLIWNFHSKGFIYKSYKIIISISIFFIILFFRIIIKTCIFIFYTVIIIFVFKFRKNFFQKFFIFTFKSNFNFSVVGNSDFSILFISKFIITLEKDDVTFIINNPIYILFKKIKLIKYIKNNFIVFKFIHFFLLFLKL